MTERVIVGDVSGESVPNGNGTTFLVNTGTNVRDSDGKITGFVPKQFNVFLPLSAASAEAQIASDKNLNESEQSAIRAIAADTAGQDAAIRAAHPTLPVSTTAAAKSEASLQETSPPLNNVQSIGASTETEDLDLIKTAYPNLLHNYGSYTYSLTLSAMTLDTYNKMLKKPGDYKPQNVMIASAGRWNGSTQKDPRFDVDFFFDKLDFETVIGMTTTNRNSNALSSEFTIIEPYGMTLINRLIEMSNDINSANKGNYIQLPYMLQIDFFGSDDNGNPMQIPNISKYIPILITGIKFKIGIKGTEYNISAVPYSQQAFSESIGTTPINCEVAASSIGHFFLANPGVTLYNSSATEQTKSVTTAKDNTGSPQVVRDASTPKSTERTSSQKGDAVDEVNSSSTYLYSMPDASKNVRSYTGAINAWYKEQIKNKKIEVADEILFAIDKDIAKAVFPTKQVISKAARAMSIDSPQDSLYSNLDDKNNPIGLITINQGKSIIDVISLAVRNSSYILSQFLDINKDIVTESQMEKFLNEPLNWFIVTSKIELLGYDRIRNTYAKRITYYIDKKVIPQAKNPEAPLGPPRKVCKDYQYIFTGKNQDVLNFDLNFDTQFYIVNPSNAANSDLTAQNNDKIPSKSEKISTDSRILTTKEIHNLLDQRVAGINELRAKKVQVAKITGTPGYEGTKAEQVQQLEKNIFATPGGDMVQVTLKIIGDPDFIKQDDCFYSRNDVGSDPRKNPNGSLITDAADLYVNLTFKTPVDYDDAGLASPTSSEKFSSSLFSGIYRIITVKNHFSNGKFEQELNLIRYAMQATQGLAAPTDAANNTTRENTIKQLEEARLAGLKSGVTSNPITPPKTSITDKPAETKADVATPTGTVARSAIPVNQRLTA